MRFVALALSAVGAFILGMSSGNLIIALAGGAICGLGVAIALSGGGARREEGASTVTELLRVIYGVYGVHGATTEIVNVIGSRMDRELLQRLARAGGGGGRR